MGIALVFAFIVALVALTVFFYTRTAKETGGSSDIKKTWPRPCPICLIGKIELTWISDDQNEAVCFTCEYIVGDIGTKKYSEARNKTPEGRAVLEDVRRRAKKLHDYLDFEAERMHDPIMNYLDGDARYERRPRS